MIEQPNYDVLKQEGPFELRLYQAFTVIEAPDSDLRGNQGFYLAFNFIQGDNERRQKIAMTAPVVNRMSDRGIETTAFVMPPKMRHEDVPDPTETALRKILIPERLCAVIRFSSNPTMTMIKDKENALREWIAKEALDITGPIQLARYNPPFMPGFLKRNELWLEVTRRT